MITHNTAQADSISKARLTITCLLAASVSLPMAWISLAKMVLFLATGGYLLLAIRCTSSDTVFRNSSIVKTILFAVCGFGVSLWWTTVNADFALQAFVKHSKILEIALLLYLIRSRREAQITLGVLLVSQTLILVLSWLMALGIPFPWTRLDDAGNHYVVFAESYIDQSMMFCTLAAMTWHMNSDAMHFRWGGKFIAVAALLNVIFLLPGRSGYLAAIAVVTLNTMWAVSPGKRWAVLIATPVFTLGILYGYFSQTHQRLEQIFTETQHYAQQADVLSSSGWRLNAWHRSMQAILEKPLMGHGVGSWAQAVKPFEGDQATNVFGAGNSSNPHQEYLLWGVELGMAGVLLLMIILFSAICDARQFSHSTFRSVCGMVAVMGIACLFNSALYDDLIGDYLCVALGVVLAYGARQTHVSESSDPRIQNT